MKKVSTAKLKKKLDAVFSKYIRWRDKGVCFTCGHTNDPKKMQCGHFVPRQYLATRYDEKNCHCQCFACNMFYGGQPSVYATKLEKVYGRGTVAKLEKLRTKIVKDFPYEEKIKHYERLVKAQNNSNLED